MKNQTERAIRSNDVSIQENYHVSKTFELITYDANAEFIHSLSNEQKQIFRKRVIECILATDMTHGT